MWWLNGRHMGGTYSLFRVNAMVLVDTAFTGTNLVTLKMEAAVQKYRCNH